MQAAFAKQLCCPRCMGPLNLQGTVDGVGHVQQGELECGSCDKTYEIVRGIPRFVPKGNYAGSFGQQWLEYRKEMLDSYSGTSLSHDRFYEMTRWSKEELEGQWILDAGCGAGRFAEIALAAGGHVVAVDLSEAVDACYGNLIESFQRRLHVVQASLYSLPFRPDSFDRAYCHGVIQHTPDPRGAMRALSRTVKAGGRLAVWIYELKWKTFVGINAWKYSLRVITRHLGYRVNNVLSVILCTVLWPVWFPLLYLGAPGRLLLALLPVAARNFAGRGFRPRQVFRCVVQDTVDMYSPAYDKPQRYSVIRGILEQSGYAQIRRTCAGLGLEAVRRSLGHTTEQPVT